VLAAERELWMQMIRWDEGNESNLINDMDQVNEI